MAKHSSTKCSMNADGHHHRPRNFLIKLYEGRERGILPMLCRHKNSRIKNLKYFPKIKLLPKGKTGH